MIFFFAYYNISQTFDKTNFVVVNELIMRFIDEDDALEKSHLLPY